MLKSLVIAVDGFSSTGKSTLARQLAKSLDYLYIDSGAMYRAVTYYAQEASLLKPEFNSTELIRRLSLLKIEFKLIGGEQRLFLNDKNIDTEIRSMEVSSMVSEVSSISEVRSFLVNQQRAMSTGAGIVMDGRDIGTVVFPDADLKIFVTAAPKIRAERRYKELKAKGDEISFEQVRENLAHRDHLDSTRADSPLRQANDAKVLDNTMLGMEDQLRIAEIWVQELLKD